MTGRQMCDHRNLSDSSSSAPGTSSSRASFALGRSLPGRASLNPPPPGRLSSLRSRDLTLGGFKKKTFVPNFHSVRKTKDEQREEHHCASKKEKREKDDKQKEGRGRRRERPQTIQSHSIFEQGPADTIRRIGSWDSPERSECGPPAVFKCVKKEKHTFEDEESEILQKLKRDDFLDDPGLKNDAKNRPIQLPLHQSIDFFTVEEKNINIKEEPAAGKTSLRALGPQQMKHPQMTKGALNPQQPNVAELFQQLSLSNDGELLFIQLPDTIPGQPITTADKVAKKERKSEDRHALPFKTPDPIRKESTSTLSDFSEGHIGKLRIRKSGKVQLVLGEVITDISEGAAFSFLQQLVSVRLSEGLTGDMTVLGNVRHKLVCSPDFEELLKDVKYSS
ncbi:DNA-directed RNA polymerase III subunit RPC4 [Lepisosteus oculatus]|uniref:DNA-directed RNA polymerase III subunit RPC4 n=1 Tax=Lepisosteus oculatus TaxID=7918 RepID=UPI0037145598